MRTQSLMAKKQIGFGLVEMMIALTLGLLLFSGVGQLLVSSSRSWALQDEQSRIQENGRLALDLLTQYISVAGYFGCAAQTDMANVLSSTEFDQAWMVSAHYGILGFSQGSATTKAIDRNATSEAIVVHSMDRSDSATIDSHDQTNNRLVIDDSKIVDAGDLVAIRSHECDQIALLSVAANSSNQYIEYDQQSNGTIQNCSTLLGGEFECGSASQAKEKSFTSGQLSPLQSYAFYIRLSNDQPVLYRKKAGETSNGRTIGAEALVEGVEQLSIHYGFDSDDDGIVNRYFTAAQLEAFSSIPWPKIVAVQVELLLRSFTEVLTAPQSYFFAGQKQTANDGYLRRVFMTTIQLRNREHRL